MLIRLRHLSRLCPVVRTDLLVVRGETQPKSVRQKCRHGLPPTMSNGAHEDTHAQVRIRGYRSTVRQYRVLTASFHPELTRVPAHVGSQFPRWRLSTVCINVGYWCRNPDAKGVRCATKAQKIVARRIALNRRVPDKHANACIYEGLPQ
jgi:hypothetical protein